MLLILCGMSNEIISISLPTSLKDQLDNYIEQNGYTGRSHAIRDAIKHLLTQSLDERGDEHVTVITTIIYDTERLHGHGIKHDHADIIETHLHHCIDHDECVDLLILHGSQEAIQACLKDLRREHEEASLSTHLV
mgnify:CR=1 FL=1